VSCDVQVDAQLALRVDGLQPLLAEAREELMAALRETGRAWLPAELLPAIATGAANPTCR
jgi:hypothetical protein